MNEMPMMATTNYASQNYNLAQLAGDKQFLQWRQNNWVPTPTVTTPQESPMANPSRRLVQVFIADPNEHVPLESSLLYSGEQKLTDLTDQELFFEIDVRSLLAAHNEKRVGFVNKAVKERIEHLEPAKIRDLKMVVVNVATF